MRLPVALALAALLSGCASAVDTAGVAPTPPATDTAAALASSYAEDGAIPPTRAHAAS
ncbi:MAG TPA: hypothetical protein VM370_04315 [Candidatus Thermoplasmatota archaeon]|nr:hypothetical protein [Candidatus Thermoplasmatota archaeon]